MIDLPRPLAPWASKLALFPADIAIALGETVLRVARLLGAGNVAEVHEGEPDGFDGLERRGAYDHLVHAEWLLLDEAPDEFLRRVVMGEHAFLRRARTSEAASRRCVVVFDAGVEQLGAPRIVQLALLLVLAQRAESQGGTFAWGVLQDADATLHEGVTKASVGTLLASRCRRRVSQDDLARWSERVGDDARAERWIVGAEALLAEGACLRARVVTLRDAVDPFEPSRVRVRFVEALADRGREAMLEVPEASIAVRILRAPFGPAARPRPDAVSARVASDANLVFSGCATRLFVRGGSSALVTLRLPSGPVSSSLPVRCSLPDGYTLLAAGRGGTPKRVVVLSRSGAALFVHVLSKRDASVVQSQRFLPALAEGLPRLDPRHLVPLAVFADDHVAFVDDEGSVVELRDGEVHRRQGPRPVNWFVTGDLLWWRTHEGDAIRTHYLASTGKGEGFGPELRARELGFADAFVPSRTPAPIAAFTTVHGDAFVLTSKGETRTVPDADRVVGELRGWTWTLLADGSLLVERVEGPAPDDASDAQTIRANVASAALSPAPTPRDNLVATLTRAGALEVFRVGPEAAMVRLCSASLEVAP